MQFWIGNFIAINLDQLQNVGRNVRIQQNHVQRFGGHDAKFAFCGIGLVDIAKGDHFLKVHLFAVLLAKVLAAQFWNGCGVIGVTG